MSGRLPCAQVIFWASCTFLLFLEKDAECQFTTVINSPPTIIGDHETIGANTQLFVSEGGHVGSHFSAGSSDAANQNIEVNVSGGSVEGNFSAYDGSTINISGGSFGTRFSAYDGSRVNISGGSFETFFDTYGHSHVSVSGGSIGTFFFAHDESHVSISGGSIESRLWALDDSEIDISGGTIGPDNAAYDSGRIRISGGRVGGFAANHQSQVEISGGSVGISSSQGDSVVSISGGVIDTYFLAYDSSHLIISGGTLRYFNAFDESQISLIGKEFFLNDSRMEGLTIGQPFTIVDRDVTLTGSLADGTPFSYQLDSIDPSGFFISPSATLTVTLVPEPATFSVAIAALLAGGCWSRWRHRSTFKGPVLLDHDA